METSVEIARRLSEIKDKLEEIEARFAHAIEPLMDEQTALSAELLVMLGNEGLGHLKLDNGRNFIRAVRTSLEVTDEVKAFTWAVANNSVKLDKTKATKILKRELTIPEGFEMSETAYLSVRTDS